MQWGLHKLGGFGNSLLTIGAAHVEKTFLDMLTSQVWENSKFKELLLVDNCCIFAFFLEFKTSLKRLFASYDYFFVCLFVRFSWYLKQTLESLTTSFLNIQMKYFRKTNIRLLKAVLKIK